MTDAPISRRVLLASVAGTLGALALDRAGVRSEEGRGGEEGRSRGVPDHLKKKKKITRVALKVHTKHKTHTRPIPTHTPSQVTSHRRNLVQRNVRTGTTLNLAHHTRKMNRSQ